MTALSGISAPNARWAARVLPHPFLEYSLAKGVVLK